MKKNAFRTFTIIAGILLAVAVLCMNIFGSHVGVAKKHEKVKTEQQTPVKETALNASPSITPPSSIAFEPLAIIYCIFEIENTNAPENLYPVDISFKAEKLLITLFQVIISPNAP